MLTSHPLQAVALWFADARPVRFVYAGERWRVTDMPTPLFGEDAAIPPIITHPPIRRLGWRFQATSERDVTRMFEVIEDGNGWAVSRVFD